VKQSDPLTPAEIAVFGADAWRRPDGSIEEQGIKWPGSSPEAAELAAAAASEAVQPAQPERPGAPIPADASLSAALDRLADVRSPVEPTIDLRLVHPWPEMKQ
jgi:hypothetical protein